MSTATMTADSTRSADRRLALGGGACVIVGGLSLALRLTGALPSGLATLVILTVTVIGLRIFVGYAAKSASSPHRQRITRLIAVAGLACSAITVFAALPTLLRGGGGDHFSSNLIAHLWTIVILLVVAGTARTLNWLALLGLALTSFLAISGLAYTVGRPVVTALGESNAFADAVYVPFTEEILKALPAILLVIFAARRRDARPAATEMALVGAILGAGLALYEDAQYHRGGFDVTKMPLVSFLNPSATNDSGFQVAYASAGHMIWTSLVVFGFALGVLYRRSYSWAKFAIPVTFSVSLLEHCTQNYAGLVSVGDGNSAVFDLLRILTLWGWLSSLLLIAGIVLVARRERRATRNGLPLPAVLSCSLWLRPVNARRSAAALARLQITAAPSPKVDSR